MNKEKNRIELGGNAKYIINAQCTIYVDNPKKAPKRETTQGQGGLSESNPLRSDGSHDGQAGG
jgi:hypothetical protein